MEDTDNKVTFEDGAETNDAEPAWATPVKQRMKERNLTQQDLTGIFGG